MIAHVAEASEGSGRVVLWLDPSVRASPQAIDISVRLAAAYGSEIETVEVDPPYLEPSDGVPMRRVDVRPSVVMADLSETDARACLSDGHRRSVDQLAAELKVPVRHARTSGEPIDRLSHMCTVRGPWNIIALSRAPSLDMAEMVSSVFANVSGATGVIVASRHEAAWYGRVAVIAEDSERLPSMLRAAERMVGPNGATHLVIAAATKSVYDELEAQSRLLPEVGTRIIFETTGPTLGVDGALDEKLIRARPSLVIARFGGTLLSDGRALSRCLAVTGAPFLLVR